jgi:hypothetical protein
MVEELVLMQLISESEQMGVAFEIQGIISGFRAFLPDDRYDMENW